MDEFPHLGPVVLAFASFATDIMRLCVWLILLTVIFVPLERLFALHRQKTFRPDFVADVCYYFVSSLVPKVLLVIPVAVLARGLHFIVPSGVEAGVAGLPLVVRLAGALIVGELGFYWGHRWTHAIPFLWRFHAVHHSARHVDWLVNTRAHPLDIVFTRLCGFIPMYVLGFAQPMTNTLDTVPMLVLLAGTVWGFFIHANVGWRLGWLAWLVSTPGFHHWHHANDGSGDRNFASMLPVLDRIFGTFHLPDGRWPVKYGTDTPIAADFGGQLMQPLRRDGRWR